MYYERAPELHIVDDAAQFSAAQFIEPHTTEFVWENIITLLVTVYTELPNTLVFDDGSQFRNTFVEIWEIHDVERQRSGT